MVAALSLLAGSMVTNVALAQEAAVVITGTRVPQRLDQALAEVTVIDRGAIEAAGGRTLAELLAREAGVQFWSNGGLGKTASVSLRGLESRHTLLLVDGVRYGSATLGTPVWDNLPLSAIDRIEIVRGPLSGLYGSDAVGGVVQVFTRGGTPGLKVDASATVGANAYQEAAAGLRFGQGAFDGALRLQHQRTEGFSATHPGVPFGNHDPDDDGFRQSSVSARGGVRFGAGERWRADAQFLRSRGLSRFDDGPGADARAVVVSEVASLAAQGPVSGRWRTLVRVAQSIDENDVQASASSFTTLGTTGTEQRQLSIENTVSTPWGTLLGVLERLQQHVTRPGAAFDLSERRIDSVALGLGGQAGGHHWQANARHDRNSQFGSQATGSLAWGIDLAPAVRAAAQLGTGFVAPSFNQLYFPGFGNPALQPEEALQRELSLRWRAGEATARVAWFEHRIRGYIASGPLPANIPRTRIEGITASVDAPLASGITVAASLDSLDPRNASEGTAGYGKVLPRRVQDSARLALDWRGGALAAGATLAAFGERFDDAANTQRLGGYATLDLRTQWRLAPAWTLDLKLNNALDKRYQTVLGYNQPGREAYLSLRYADL